MRGRLLNNWPADEIALIVGPRNPLANYSACLNIAPMDPALTVRFDPKITGRTLDVLHGGSLGSVSEPFQVGNGDTSYIASTQAAH
jgi:hypothetical protein